jgi:hypothetical protein
MKRVAILLFFLASLALHAEDWGPLQFLIGDWAGEGGGQPGQASAGSFSFTPDLQGTILVRRSFAEYPPANGRSAFRHDDLTILYRDAASKQLRATYWDNEGHIIQYSVQTADGGVVFASEGPPSGQRFRISYAKAGTSQVKIRFEIAAPGKDFAPYVEASARKK